MCFGKRPTFQYLLVNYFDWWRNSTCHRAREKFQYTWDRCPMRRRGTYLKGLPVTGRIRIAPSRNSTEWDSKACRWFFGVNTKWRKLFDKKSLLLSSLIPDYWFEVLTVWIKYSLNLKQTIWCNYLYKDGFSVPVPVDVCAQCTNDWKTVGNVYFLRMKTWRWKFVLASRLRTAVGMELSICHLWNVSLALARALKSNARRRRRKHALSWCRCRFTRQWNALMRTTWRAPQTVEFAAVKTMPPGHYFIILFFSSRFNFSLISSFFSLRFVQFFKPAVMGIPCVPPGHTKQPSFSSYQGKF